MRKCPNCGSTDINTHAQTQETRYQCAECGHVWGVAMSERTKGKKQELERLKKHIYVLYEKKWRVCNG